MLLALVLMAAAIALVAFYAPEDANQGLSQKIFYFHVPIALTAYACFGWGAWKALRYLWRREERYDLESYVAIHLGVIFGAMTLLTGSIWAKISWGVWWTWSSNQLVLFLVLFLFYSTYFMLRFSVEDGPMRANLSAVYALFGVVLIPISFLAIRLANDFIHPPCSRARGPQMSRLDVRDVLRLPRGDARARGLVLRDRARRQAARREAARAAGAARLVTASEKYVAAAYLVVFVTVLAYVLIIGAKLGRLEREVAELTELAEAEARWLSCSSGLRLLAYGEAAAAYYGEARHPGRLGRAATWGVRVGWLLQTALLIVQAVSADGFPWGSWAGSLNLFVWLVVGIYLVWGCNSPLPPARARGAAARGGAVRARLRGRRDLDRGDDQPAEPLPRPPRRARARRLRRLHPRGRALGALPLAGAAAEAARAGDPQGDDPVARRRSTSWRRGSSSSRCPRSRSGSRSGSCGCAPTAAASTR